MPILKSSKDYVELGEESRKTFNSYLKWVSDTVPFYRDFCTESDLDPSSVSQEDLSRREPAQPGMRPGHPFIYRTGAQKLGQAVVQSLQGGQLSFGQRAGYSIPRLPTGNRSYTDAHELSETLLRQA